MSFRVELRIFRPDDTGGCKFLFTVYRITSAGGSSQLVSPDDEFSDAETAERKGRVTVSRYMRNRYRLEPEAYELNVRRAEEA